MKIDPDTLLLSEFTSEEAADMESWARHVILDGDLPPHPEWLKEWFRVGGFEVKQQLRIIATVAPARVLLSLLTHEPVDGKGS